MATDNKTALIQLEGIHKTYQDGVLKVHALCDINLSVGRGELITIMGPSGSGKSTLLHILGCLDHPTEGRYLFDGEDTNEYRDRKLAETRNQRIGFVFQSFNLLQRETAIENVTLPLMYAGANEAQSRAKEALRKVGLGERLNHRPGQLSGGEQQRVAIARAIVKRPDVILADEPTGNLDTQVGSNIKDVFKNLHADGLTIVLITHNPDVAEMGTRKLKLRDGQLEA
ncbi:MAG: macrolide ABC transporter ATP-binding protein [Verrucomicrobiales bacterium]|nr:macrolide ABC transporter ATP-binding protein [Verrucomicrobiales bacterium]